MTGLFIAGAWPQANAASAPFIFFIAADSIWRIRSADTPNSSASSCSVAPPEPSSLTSASAPR
jgi:hypothetical protein